MKIAKASGVALFLCLLAEGINMEYRSKAGGAHAVQPAIDVAPGAIQPRREAIQINDPPHASVALTDLKSVER